jgi:hypothetical protein
MPIFFGTKNVSKLRRIVTGSDGGRFNCEKSIMISYLLSVRCNNAGTGCISALSTDADTVGIFGSQE